MENRNSIAGNIPVASQSKAVLTNSLDRPLSFTEGVDDHSANFSETFPILPAAKNNVDASKTKLTSMKHKKSGVDLSSSSSSSSSNKTFKHVKVGKKPNVKSISDDSENEPEKDGQSMNSQESKVNSSAGQASQPKSKRRVSGEWEILEGLKAGQSFTFTPGKYAGFMMKNRKWPMKGWHKRYFSLDNGFLTYAKSSSDIERGKFHGQVDVGLSVIVCKSRGFRIDMDADDTIYHLKTKTKKDFDEWISYLRDHRLYRQNAISCGCGRELSDIINTGAYASSMSSPLTPVDDVADGDNNVFSKDPLVLELNRNPVTRDVTLDNIGTSPVLMFSEEINEVQLKLFDLGSLLSALNAQSFNNNVATSSSGKKDKIKKHAIGRLNKKEKRLKVPDASPPLVKCSSNPSLVADDDMTSNNVVVVVGNNNNSSSTLQPPASPCASTQVHDRFLRQAEYIHCRLKKLCNQMLVSERSKSSDQRIPAHNLAYVQSLKNTISELKKQNIDYRARLARIHQESATPEHIAPFQHPMVTPTPSIHHEQKVSANDFSPKTFGRRSMLSSDSLDSQNNEFYDAPDQLDQSSEGTELEEEEEDEASDSELKTNLSLQPNLEERFSRFQMRRRSRLPSPSVESDVSIWGLLRKNIGKDLSKISMPVGMNEPLNALQRLCEELEYSELLERAADIDDPFERMVWVAVFTVSSYSSTFTRAGYKPFNPLLGETFECDRPEKGWRFMAEQVSHHPPVTACYCESKDFSFWQDMQVKTKFWGKSMEVQPIGLVNLRLLRHKEDYTWNKATSCIHNILGGQRWVEHYGEVIVTNHTRGIVCKLNFTKSSYFSAKKYEVYGQVSSLHDDLPVHHLFGRWNENMFHGQSESSAKCIWRPGALPPDHQMYYGFTKFAMELNEIDPEQAKNYPITDTRFRPDQRLLECGKLEEADAEKRRVEQKQREMRKQEDFVEGNYQPKWFIRRSDPNGKETFEYNGQYWSKRKNPGFSALNLPQLW